MPIVRELRFTKADVEKAAQGANDARATLEALAPAFPDSDGDARKAIRAATRVRDLLAKWAAATPKEGRSISL